jgi:hypothetical protein
MASKRHMRRKACAGKVRHSTHEGAVIAWRKMKQRTGESLSIYHCDVCQNWHIGHNPAYRNPNDMPDVLNAISKNITPNA